MTKPKAKIEMGQRESGLTVPPEAMDACRHAEVFQRIKPQMNQYHCQGCGEKLLMVILQFALMTHEEFEHFKKAQIAAAQAAKRKQETGLVLPDEARREQQEKKRP